MDITPLKPAQEPGQYETKRPAEDGYSSLPGGPEGGSGRHCTDLLCFLIFTVFVVAYVGVAVVGYQRGNPSLLMYPFDSSGNQCGLPDSNAADYKHLYYVTPTTDISYTVCVKDCPKNSTSIVECLPNTWVMSCDFSIRDKDNSTSSASPYPTNSVLHRFCVPTAEYVGNMTNIVDSRIKTHFASSTTDIMTCWLPIVYVMLISIGISIVYIIVLRYFVGLVLWISIFVIFAGAIAFGYYLKVNADEKYSDPSQESEHEKQIYISYACYAGAAIFAIIICFMRTRIQLAIAIMKSAASFVGDEFTVLLVPLVSFFSTIGIIIFWLFALAFLYSAGEVQQSEKYKTFAAVKWDDETRNLFYFEAASILWINAFKIALVQFTIACTVFFWYFEQGTDRNMHFKFFHGFWAGVRYHIGSLAFGSFILALVQLVQLILTYVQKYIYSEKYAGNIAVQWLCGCVSCLIECFKRFIEFLNKNAYISMAYTSESFCQSAKRVFFLLLENAARFLALGSIGTVFTFLGKGVITLLSAYLGYLIINSDTAYSESIESPVPVLVVFVLVSYVVSGLFLSVYEMACDSIIIYFLYDEEMHSKQAKHAPEPLKEFMEEHRGSEPQRVAPA